MPGNIDLDLYSRVGEIGGTEIKAVVEFPQKYEMTVRIEMLGAWIRILQVKCIAPPDSRISGFLHELPVHLIESLLLVTEILHRVSGLEAADP